MNYMSYHMLAKSLQKQIAIPSSGNCSGLSATNKAARFTMYNLRYALGKEGIETMDILA